MAADRLERRGREHLGHEVDVDPLRSVGWPAFAGAAERLPGQRADGTVREQLGGALKASSAASVPGPNRPSIRPGEKPA